MIVSKGYLTEIGIHHMNEFNQFNFASDVIEIFRPLVDRIVYEQVENQFTKEERRQLLQLLEEKIFIRNGEHFLQQVMQIYIEGLLHYLNTGDEQKLIFPTWK